METQIEVRNRLIQNNNNILKKDFTENELKKAINMIRKNSAPDRDGIEYRIIKELPKKMHEIMLKLFNEIWRCQNIPRKTGKSTE